MKTFRVRHRRSPSIMEVGVLPSLYRYAVESRSKLNDSKRPYM